MNDGAETTERLYAWLTTDTSKGIEGIITVNTTKGLVPLVGTDLEAAQGMRNIVEQVCERSKSEARLVVFNRGEVLDTVDQT